MLKSDHSVEQLCSTLQVSRSGYYRYIKGQSYLLSPTKAAVAQQVKTVFEAHESRYGWRRIQVELAAQGTQAGRHQIRRHMREQGLKALQPKSFVPCTTQTNPMLKRLDNLLLDFTPTAPLQVVVGDITYLPNQEIGYGKWLYLAVWMDLFSRRLLGWAVDRHMEQSLIIRAFDKFTQQRADLCGLIVHSDGGGQYQAHDFKALLHTHQCRQSMTRKDNPYDNAHIESLFSRLKTELLQKGCFYGLADAEQRLFEFIEGYYNARRRHSALGYLSPIDFENQFYLLS